MSTTHDWPGVRAEHHRDNLTYTQLGQVRTPAGVVIGRAHVRKPDARLSADAEHIQGVLLDHAHDTSPLGRIVDVAWFVVGIASIVGAVLWAANGGPGL